MNGTTVGATREAGEPSHDPSDTGSGSPNATVWFQWQAPASASVTIDTVGNTNGNTNFDTILAVYTSLSSAGRVTFNDDINPGVITTSRVTFAATAGTVYKIVVDGWGGDTGNFILNWSQSNCAPSTLALEQNTNQLAAVDSVTFVRGPFALTDDHNFSSDHRTRIIFFTTDLGFPTSQPDVNTLAVVINGTSYPIENVGPSSSPPGSYVVFRLPDQLSPGTYAVSIKARGVMSANSPTITIVSSPNVPVADSSQTILNALYPLVRLLL